MTKRLNKKSKVSNAVLFVVIFFFSVAIIAVMVFGFLGDKNLIDKKFAEHIFAICWVIGVNMWYIGVIITGEVHWWGGGRILVSRVVNPIKFWIFVILNFIIFNTAGLLFLIVTN